MKLGIVSFNFPPILGGMQNHAFGLCTELAKKIDINVFTDRQLDPYPSGFPVQHVLQRDLVYDIPTLLRHGCDGWLVLDAGYARFALAAPNRVFVYCHGNDFLAPIILQGYPWERAIEALDEVPIAWRAKEWLQKLNSPLRRRRVIDGIRRATHVFANSKYTRDTALRFVPELESRISISNPGVDERFFQRGVNNTQGTPNQTVRITTISRLQSVAKRKNIDGCLRALSRIKDQITFSYTIIGDGDDRDRLEKLSVELGLDDRTHFLGAISTNEMIDRLDATDLFLLVPVPSKTDVEGFGIVYVEAAARGVPSILSALGPVDTVIDGQTGMVISGVSPDQIADGILRFAQERHRFDRQKIREFSEKFRWSTILDGMLPVIERGLIGSSFGRN